jgi:hypothetical protein
VSGALPSLCPICGAGSFDCNHGIVRWFPPECAYESCTLLKETKAYEAAVRMTLRKAWRARTPPADRALKVLYFEGRELRKGADHRHAAWSEISPGIGAFVVEAIERLPGVIATSESNGPRSSETLALWAQDVEGVRKVIRDWVCAMEVELSRD